MIAGPIVDRRGPAPVLVVGLVAFMVGLVVGGLAPTMEVLVVGRFIQGAGAGMVNAVSFATVALAYAPADRSRVLALFSLAWLLPSVIGAAAGGHRGGGAGLALGVPGPRGADAAVRAAGRAPGARAAAGRRPRRGRAADGSARSCRPPARCASRRWCILLASMAILGAVSFAPLALTDIRGLSSVEAGVTIAMLSISWSAGTFLQGRFPRVPTATVARVGVACAGRRVAHRGAVGGPGGAPAADLGRMAADRPGRRPDVPGVDLHLMAHALAGGEGRATAAGQLASVSGNGIGTWLGGVLLSVALGAGLALEGALGVVFAACAAAVSWPSSGRCA